MGYIVVSPRLCFLGYQRRDGQVGAASWEYQIQPGRKKSEK